MSSASKVFAFVAYLIPLVGPLLVLLLRRDDAFAMFHVKQSLRLLGGALLMLLVAAAIAYGLLFIPLAGPVMAAGFSAVIMLLVFGILFAWLSGMINALRAMRRPVPFFGSN